MNLRYKASLFYLKPFGINSHKNISFPFNRYEINCPNIAFYRFGKFRNGFYKNELFGLDFFPHVANYPLGIIIKNIEL